MVIRKCLGIAEQEINIVAATKDFVLYNFLGACRCHRQVYVYNMVKTRNCSFVYVAFIARIDWFCLFWRVGRVILVYVCDCLHHNVCTASMGISVQASRGHLGESRMDVSQRVVLGTYSGPLQEKQVLFIAELSFQPWLFYFFSYWGVINTVPKSS